MSGRHHKLDPILAPSAVALVGASEKSTFTKMLLANFEAVGRSEDAYLVNRRATNVFGRPAFGSCCEIGRSIDLAILMVPAAAIEDALRDAAAAGAKGATILSSGYAETGPAGRERQNRLVQLAHDLGLVLFGPNVLGFVNVASATPAITLANPPRTPGQVALVSQSGACCGAMMSLAASSGVALSHVFTTGNEAMLGVADLVDYLVDQNEVRAVAVFMESIRDAGGLAAAAHRAAEAEKALVVLKAGRSELAAHAAAAHTGALVGDDRVVDAVLRRLGVIRVDTIEDLLVTAGTAARVGRLRAGGLGVVSISGGACELVADLAAADGVPLAEFEAGTLETLEKIVPDYGHIENPVDLTGAAVIEPRLFTDAVAAVGADPGVNAVCVVNTLPWREQDEPFYAQRAVDAIGAGAALSPVPLVYLTQVVQPITDVTARSLAQGGVPHAVTGLRSGIEALGRVAAWSTRPAWHRTALELAAAAGTGEARAISEAQARELLGQAGVGMVPARHVHSEAEARAVAVHFAEPVSVKIVSADIPHKSDVGGVRLGVAPEDAGTAYTQVTSAAPADAVVDGALVSPMRSGGTELLIGVTRDPQWGLLMAVGLGGIFVEVLADVAIEPLPVTHELAVDMLTRLRGARLLQGVRGGKPADLDAIAATMVAVSELALHLGPDLEILEINPLLVDGSRAEALDALVIRR